MSGFARLRDWPGLTTVLTTETIYGLMGSGTMTTEVCHSLSSSTMPPEVLAQSIRRLWAIKNSEHWILDVNFGEDRS